VSGTAIYLAFYLSVGALGGIARNDAIDPKRSSREKFHSLEYGCFGGLNCVLQELFQFLEEAGQAGVLL
jgi:hypothetical protein